MTNHNQVVLVSKNKPDLYYRGVRTCKPSYKWILVNLEDAETSFKELYVLFGRANLPWMLLEAAGLDTSRWHLSKRKKETEETNRSWQVEYKYLKLKKKTHNKQSSASCHLLPHRRPLTGVLIFSASLNWNQPPAQVTAGISPLTSLFTYGHALTSMSAPTLKESRFTAEQFYHSSYNLKSPCGVFLHKHKSHIYRMWKCSSL